jgi:hypothetical protein
LTAYYFQGHVYGIIHLGAAMFKTFLLSAVILAGFAARDDVAQADTQKGRCAVVASSHGAKKFVVLKCDRASSPGNFIIRSEVWEKDDRSRYNKLARFSGHRFTCDITYNNTTRGIGVETSHYKVSKCR